MVPNLALSGGDCDVRIPDHAPVSPSACQQPLSDPITDVRDSDPEWPLWVDSSRSRSSHFGQKRSLAGAWRNDRLRIRKRTIEPIAAARNDLFVGYAGFAIWKRKQLVGPDFVAL